MKTQRERFFEYFKNEQFLEAATLYESSFTDTDDKNIKNYYGRALFHIKNYDKSIQVFDELLAESPSSELFYHKASSQILNGETDKGLSTYQELITYCNSIDLKTELFTLYITHSLIEAYEVERSEEFIKKLQLQMKTLQGTDVYLLFRFNLPQYSEFLYCLKRYLEMLPKEKSKAELETFLPHQSEENYEILNKYSQELFGETLPPYKEYRLSLLEKKKEQKQENDSNNLIWVIIIIGWFLIFYFL